jgi:hypothetical protein
MVFLRANTFALERNLGVMVAAIRHRLLNGDLRAPMPKLVVVPSKLAVLLLVA